MWKYYKIRSKNSKAELIYRTDGNIVQFKSQFRDAYRESKYKSIKDLLLMAHKNFELVAGPEEMEKEMFLDGL